MKQMIFAAALISTPLAVHAEEERGLTLMERGAQLFFEGLMREVDPALKELEEMMQEMEPALRSFAEEMGPALRGLIEDVEDWSAYHPPEVLPNGDIILGKKSQAERDAAPKGDDIEI